MLNIIKWDFINYIRRRYWIYFGFAAAFILAVLPDNPVSPVFDGLSTGYGVFFYIFTMIFSIIIPIGWLRKSSAQLELSVPAKPWKKLLGKLVLSACIITSTLLLTELLMMQVGRSGFSGISVFADAVSFFQYLLFVLTIVSTVMFSYITAKSFAPTRKIAGLITVVLFIAIYVLIAYSAFAASINTGIINVESITSYGEISITANQAQSFLGSTLSIIIPSAMIAVFFFVSSILLKKRFERY